jgi:hypothetical protein
LLSCILKKRKRKGLLLIFVNHIGRRRVMCSDLNNGKFLAEIGRQNDLQVSHCNWLW